jgi:hypothetical protein
MSGKKSMEDEVGDVEVTVIRSGDAKRSTVRSQEVLFLVHPRLHACRPAPSYSLSDPPMFRHSNCVVVVVTSIPVSTVLRFQSRSRRHSTHYETPFPPMTFLAQ